MLRRDATEEGFTGEQQEYVSKMGLNKHCCVTMIHRNILEIYADRRDHNSWEHQVDMPGINLCNSFYGGMYLNLRTP